MADILFRTGEYLVLHILLSSTLGFQKIYKPFFMAVASGDTKQGIFAHKIVLCSRLKVHKHFVECKMFASSKELIATNSRCWSIYQGQ